MVLVVEDVSFATRANNQQSFESIRAEAKKLTLESISVMTDATAGQLVKTSFALYYPVLTPASR